MGIFDDAVHEAANAVKPFAQALDDSHRECQEALRYVQSLQERLKADREALDEVVEALVHDAKEVDQALSGVTADATANLGLVKEAVGHAALEWEAVFEAEETALTSAAAELLPQLAERVKELAEKAETASHGVIEWAANVSHELDKAVDSVEQAVSVGMASLVADWKRSMEATVARRVEFLEKEWPEAVSTQETAWRQKVDQIHTLLAHTFVDMSDHNQQVKDYTEEKWGELKDEQMKSTHEAAQHLAGELSSLGQTADNYEGQVEVAGGLVVEQQRHAAEAATQLAEGLIEVRGRWGTFGITC